MNVLSNQPHINCGAPAFVTCSLKFATLRMFLASAAVAITLLGFTGKATAQSQEMLRYGTSDPAPSNLQLPLAEKGLPTLAQMGPAALGELEHLLASELERAANLQPRLKGQGRIFEFKARFDVARDVLVVDFGKSYVPLGERYITVQLEEHLHDLDAIVDDLMRGVIGNFRGVDQLFGGKPLHYYLPDPVQTPSRKSETTFIPTPAAAAVIRVMLNGGHGWYLHSALGWTSQRRGSRQRSIGGHHNPLHVLELSNWMMARGTTVLGRPRSPSRIR